ncbi:MAG: prolyl oligopeptidase family serine peptidase [Chloroflexia bacterium]
MLLLLFLSGALAASDLPWKISELRKAPQSWEATTTEPGVKAVWIAGPEYKGKATRAFAYYGVPAGGNAPGMVLLHGGGGTAFAEWVRMWNARGFAAIAVDTVGTRPATAEAAKLWNPERSRHEFSGPAGWGDFVNVDAPVGDQWTYHAVAVSIAAHSFLRAQAGVDRGRIGLTGISWGGYLTDIVASLDSRFRFGIPVYGCGYLGEDSAWLGDFKKLGEERAAKWLKLWDPSVYLAQGKRPMFWVNGTNDFAYVMASWQKSYRLPHGERLLSLQVRMKHSHPDGAKPEEVFAYAKSRLMGGEKLIAVKRQGVGDGKVWAGVTRRPAKAEICFTRDVGKWQERKWETSAAEIEGDGKRVSATVPAGSKVYYLNFYDAAGLVTSSEHVEAVR